MCDDLSASNAAAPSRDRVRVLVQTLLRGALASGLTDDILEGASGVKARAIKSYRVEGKEPSLTAALGLAQALGPSAVNAMIGLIGFGKAETLDADTADLTQLLAQLLPHITVIAQALADGRIDHLEAPGTREAAHNIIALVTPLSRDEAA